MKPIATRARIVALLRPSQRDQLPALRTSGLAAIDRAGKGRFLAAQMRGETYEPPSAASVTAVSTGAYPRSEPARRRRQRDQCPAPDALLKRLGHTVVMVTDGGAAIESLASRRTMQVHLLMRF